jgi:hypothetical protein
LRCMKALVFREDLCVEMNSSYAEKLDWDWIVKTSYDQRLLGFVAFILGKQNLLRNLDHRIQAKLKVGLLKSQSENQFKQRQFQEVNRILSARFIPVIPLKGIALTQLIYEHVPFRRMRDIDILVQQSDLDQSFRLLAQAGFRRLDTYQSKNRWHEKIYAETDSLWANPILGRIALFLKGLELDVHFNPRYRIEQKYIEMDVARIWERALPFPKLGRNVFILDSKDLLLHLLLHTVEFHSPRLIQALDTACVIEKYKIPRSDISDQINVAAHSSKLVLDGFVNAIQELLNIEPGNAGFSPESTDVFERFFLRKSIPDLTLEGLIKTEKPIVGLEMFKKIRSPRKRLIFMAGYLLPNPDYYPQKRSKVPYFMHWWELICKVWRLARSRFSKTNL